MNGGDRDIFSAFPLHSPGDSKGNTRKTIDRRGGLMFSPNKILWRCPYTDLLCTSLSWCGLICSISVVRV